MCAFRGAVVQNKTQDLLDFLMEHKETQTGSGKCSVLVNPFDIGGLTLVQNFLSDDEQSAVIECIGQLEWSPVIKRKTMQFGYEYHYRSQNSRPEKGEPIPDALKPICQRLKDEGYFEHLPDQIIVNHYEPNEGIGKHIDHPDFWGPSVASISLLSEWSMEFSRVIATDATICDEQSNTNDAEADNVCNSAEREDVEKPQELKHKLTLPIASLVVLRGPARYEWKHGIPRNYSKKASHEHANVDVPPRSGARMSVTFRTYTHDDSSRDSTE